MPGAVGSEPSSAPSGHAGRLTANIPKAIPELRQQLDAATAERQRTQAALDALPRPVDRNISRPLVTDANKSIQSLADARNAHEAALREHLMNVLGTNAPPLLAEISPGLDARGRAAAEEGMAFLGRLAGPGRAVPLVRIERMPKGERPEYVNGRIRLPKSADTAEVLHEYGHHLENDPGVLRAANRFWRERFHGTDEVALATEFPGGNFDEGDVGHRNKTGRIQRLFPNRPDRALYIGKRITKQSGTEIVTVGLELLYGNPIHFARTDPEYFNLVVGTLKGEHDHR
ncbi:hypothetical protein [Gemmata massiliana]|uniref:hypothetical protein n=1 Tax=Gemmata massiliana TaxID=1210884 RepID=UPI0013A6CDFD|nr:hypothetical protein [Gemmata massiliana]